MTLPDALSLCGLGRRLFGPRERPCPERAEYLLRWGDDGIRAEDDAYLNIGVAGIIGSGKSTAAVMRAMLNALRCGTGWSVYCTTAKVSDVAEYQAIARRAGVPCHLSGPNSPLTLDVMGSITRHSPDPAAAVADFLQGLGGLVFRGEMSHEKIWEAFSKDLIFAACVLLHAADGAVTTQNLLSFLMEAATSDEQLKSEAFRQTGHYRTLRRASDAKLSPSAATDVANALDHFTAFFPSLNDRTRSSIMANTLASLNILNRGILRDKLAAASPNFSFEAMEQEPSLFISGWPVAAMKDMGRVAQAAERYALQTYLMTRAVTAATRSVMVVSDEYHQHVLSTLDPHFFAMSRAQKVCNLVAFQNRELLDDAFGGDASGHTKTDALLSNLGNLLIFASVGESAAWAAKRIGSRLSMICSATSNRSWGKMPDLWNPEASQSSATVTEQMLEIIPAYEFSTLRRANGAVAECVVQLNRPMSHGLNYAKVLLPQLLLEKP